MVQLFLFHLIYDDDPSIENLTFVEAHRFKIAFFGMESYLPDIKNEYKDFTEGTENISLLISNQFILSSPFLLIASFATLKENCPFFEASSYAAILQTRGSNIPSPLIALTYALPMSPLKWL